MLTEKTQNLKMVAVLLVLMVELVVFGVLVQMAKDLAKVEHSHSYLVVLQVLMVKIQTLSIVDYMINQATLMLILVRLNITQSVMVNQALLRVLQ